MTTKSLPAVDRRERLKTIAKALQRTMPAPQMELDHRSPWELLVATILSAQCTDRRVNQVTPALFRRYPGPAELAGADHLEVEQLIHSTGFFKSKAKHLIGCSKAVTERFYEQVPQTMETLITLPGVGRKTANVILGNAFGQPGIVVDTHVKRVAKRLALSKSDNPERVEEDLQQLMPKSQWTAVSQRLLLHGRYICLARKPRCGTCPVYQQCSWKEKGPQ
ncbi:MAG: endonuclease III [Nitrospirota bacterium]|nr:endonuclease III [Nitrospirota bacterium]MDP2381409.1 endonuclease III [Nitrospirota bacterium]MDP3598871.1 endonuclease III [Nitrospirota bacterium]